MTDTKQNTITYTLIPSQNVGKSEAGNAGYDYMIMHRWGGGVEKVINRHGVDITKDADQLLDIIRFLTNARQSNQQLDDEKLFLSHGDLYGPEFTEYKIQMLAILLVRDWIKFGSYSNFILRTFLMIGRLNSFELKAFISIFELPDLSFEDYRTVSKISPELGAVIAISCNKTILSMRSLFIDGYKIPTQLIFEAVSLYCSDSGPALPVIHERKKVGI